MVKMMRNLTIKRKRKILIIILCNIWEIIIIFETFSISPEENVETESQQINYLYKN